MPKLKYRELKQLAKDLDAVAQVVRGSGKQQWPTGVPTVEAVTSALDRLELFFMRLEQTDTVIELCAGPEADPSFPL